MFGTKHTKEAQAWIKKIKTAVKPQERLTGGHGPNKNGPNAGTRPKDRTRISDAYNQKGDI